jgi:hypothetical protein
MLTRLVDRFDTDGYLRSQGLILFLIVLELVLVLDAFRARQMQSRGPSFARIDSFFNRP